MSERPYAGSSQYGYNQWSPPAQSNETSNGYFLERSHSARLTLSRAIQLCPEEEPEEQEDDGEIPLGVAQQAQQCTTAQSSFAPTQQHSSSEQTQAPAVPCRARRRLLRSPADLLWRMVRPEGCACVRL
ncbi:hypothetical protein IscW_ISCW008246 [Ixodes scapularis]|uniref:Uncharacterized protein n=1 Tax=Ixodes scapularis TaxID=6945 RepID=B7PVA6_IXOSC|nr:hypothetical protein IscW_ISCW008246 [Ixodes scapularis]|eukprot:XP_002407561.1 hypothetical protein IscW_ISCW008246 [Ixodes scapularis]